MTRLLVTLMAFALLVAPPALAQRGAASPPAATPAPPPAGPTPDRTSAAYGDWTLRCEATRPPGQAALRVCEVALTFTDARGQPIAQMVVGRTRAADPMRVIVQVPLEVRVEEPARIMADPAGPASEAVTLRFKLCSVARGGCFAEVELTGDAALRRLRARGGNPGRLTFRDSAGREVQLPMSLRGFPAAMDALGREQG